VKSRPQQQVDKIPVEKRKKRRKRKRIEPESLYPRWVRLNNVFPNESNIYFIPRKCNKYKKSKGFPLFGMLLNCSTLAAEKLQLILMSLRCILIFPLLLFFICLSAQDTKKVTNRWGLGSNETFYVTKKEKIKEGPYQLVSRMGETLISGYYSEGQKDSLWIYNDYWGGVLAKHHYRKGIKTGTWEFYKNKNLAWTYDFDSSKVHFIQPEDTAANARTYLAFQDEQGNWIYHSPEKHALPISSDYFFVLMANINYPEEAVSRNQQGQCNIAVLIDEKGNPVSYEIGISSGFKSLDAEALRVIKLIEPQYIPAENKGVKVKSLVLLPVNFKMENK
jgi:TonB family protein